MHPRTKLVLASACIVIGAAYEMHYHNKIASSLGPNSSVPPHVQAAYGKMRMYGNLAEHFGRKAIDAEQKYWSLVRT
jgi:hypothetical protein